MAKWAWISTPKFSVQVDLNADNYIIDSAAITRWAIGKHLDVLINWCNKKFGNDVALEIKEDK